MTYNATNPKLNTSDLKTFSDLILLDFALMSYGARKGTVPNTVASSTDSLFIIFVLPTSQSFIVIFFELRTKIFYGFMSQCAIRLLSRLE
jgi:hypothetical protein